MDYSTPGFHVHYQHQSLHKLMFIKSVMQFNHLILCPLLLLAPSIFLSIRLFSDESVLRIRWPKYWSFSFSISPSNEYSGLISFRIDRLDLLAPEARTPLRRQHCGGRHNTKGHCHPHESSAKARGFHTKLDEGPETH